MPYSIQTERLTLRPANQLDLDFISDVHADTNIMRYISGGVPRTREQSETSLKKMLQMEKEDPRLGLWIAELNNEAIGFLLLRRPATAEKTEGLEIGFLFKSEYWNKGFATEASNAIIQYAQSHFGSVKMVALIDPQNNASRRTLNKLGFETAGSVNYIDPTNGNSLPTEILELVRINP